MPAFLLNVVVVELAGVGLLDFCCQVEVLLASLLGRHDFRVIHVNFVHSVVSLAPIIFLKFGGWLPIELAEDVFSELVV